MSFEESSVEFHGLGRVAAGLIGKSEVEVKFSLLGSEGDGFFEIEDGFLMLFDLEVRFAEGIHEGGILFLFRGRFGENLPGFILLSGLPKRNAERDFEELSLIHI